MDKLSLYEILSFVVPGFILTAIINCYSIYVFEGEQIIATNDIGDSLLLLCLSLLLGIIIHFITVNVFKWKWYTNLISQPIQSIQYDSFTKQALPFLNKEYEKIKQHQSEKDYPDDIPAENLFDFAYYYLEANDKIIPAKNFQSIYFWFRNLFTICIILFPISLIIVIYVYCKNDSLNSVGYAITISLVTIISGCIIIPIARWLRVKMADRVFGSYYVERVHQKTYQK